MPVLWTAEKKVANKFGVFLKLNLHVATFYLICLHCADNEESSVQCDSELQRKNTFVKWQLYDMIHLRKFNLLDMLKL